MSNRRDFLGEQAGTNSENRFGMGRMGELNYSTVLREGRQREQRICHRFPHGQVKRQRSLAGKIKVGTLQRTLPKVCH